MPWHLCFQTGVRLSTAPGELTKIAAYTPHRLLASAVNGKGSRETDIRDELFVHAHSIARNVDRVMNNGRGQQVEA